MTSDNPTKWFKAIEFSCFGLVLPNGWFGRPYDNQHVLEEYRITDQEIYFKFDKCREIFIVSPKEIRTEKDDSGRSNLVISRFSKLMFVYVPYGEEGKDPQVQTFTEGELSLIGYYI